MNRPRTPPRGRRGLTIYEVFLALTLLLGSLAVLSQHIAVGTRAGVRGRLQSQAALFAETKLSEVLGGVEPMAATSGAAIANAPAGWTWALEVATGPQADLLDLSVKTTHVDSAGNTDASFTLRRLVRDPQVFLDAASSTSSASGTSGSGGSPSGSGSQSGTGSSIRSGTSGSSTRSGTGQSATGQGSSSRTSGGSSRTGGNAR